MEVIGRILQHEIAALTKLAESTISIDITRLAHQLTHEQGHVYVCGVGKSGIIAQKLAATLNIVGVPAAFLHATDALHGNLGTLRPCDHLIYCSNSGETEELLAIARRAPIASSVITGNRDSTLAKLVGIILVYEVDQEAIPLVPTTSFTVMAAICDALVGTVAALKGFNRADHRGRHPGGTIGKQLASA